MDNEFEYSILVLDTVDVGETLENNNIPHQVIDTQRGLFIEIGFKTAQDHNNMIDLLRSRCGDGIFNDGEVPDHTE